MSSPTTILRQFLEGGDEDDVDERYLSALMMKASDRNVSASRRSTTATVPGLSQQHHYDGVIDDAYDVDAIDQPELLSARRRQHEHHGAMSSAHEPEMKHIFSRLSELEDSLHPVRSGAPRTVSNMEGPHDHSNYQLQLERAFQERDEAQHTAAQASALLKHQQAVMEATLEEEREQAAASLAKVKAERDSAVFRLMMEQEDMQAMRAQMEDAAVYVATLKRRLLMAERVASDAMHQRDTAEAEAAYFEQGAEAAFEYAARAGEAQDSSSSVFSLTNVKKSIEDAVSEMASLPEDAQRKKIKQLRLRWHPDKNPVLGEFAAEVTKIINAEVERLKERTQHNTDNGVSGDATSATGSPPQQPPQQEGQQEQHEQHKEVSPRQLPP